MEALSREFHTSCPWELSYAEDLVLIAQTLDRLMEKLKLWKNNMENKGLRVNMGKTKVMICGKVLDVCRKGVRRNPIFVQVVMHGFIKSKEEQKAGLLTYQIFSVTNVEV